MKIQQCLYSSMPALLLFIATAVGSAASAKTLNYAIGYPPGSDAVKVAEDYADKVENYSDGTLEIQVFPLSLLNFAETSAGLRDGITDIGYLLSPYFPAEYPHTNLVAEAAMQTQLLGETVEGKEGLAYAGALAEYIFFNCPECQAEFRDQNQVFTALGASSRYMLSCNQPVTTKKQLADKRLRVSGSHWSRWAEAFDATPVTLSGNEAFEALDQGVLDCVIISAPDLENLGIIDATTDITTDLPGGVFAAAEIANTNLGVWRSLTDQQRQAMLRASAHLSAGSWVYQQREAEVLERAESEKGITIHQASPGLVQATREFVRDDMDVLADYYEQTHGVQNPGEMLDEFRPILEKWVGLVQDVGSKDELAELYWNEVFSKVDPKTHGMQ